MIGRILRAWCAQNTTVNGLVAGRIYTQVAPPTGASYPYVVYHGITAGTYRSLRGPSGPYSETVQINVVDSSYGDALALADAIRGTYENRAFDGYSGTLTDTTGSIVVKEARWLDARSNYDNPIHGEAQGPHEIQMDFKVTYDYPS